MRRHSSDQPLLITTAPESHDHEFDRRRKRYAIMMALRAVCVIGAAATYRVRWSWRSSSSWAAWCCPGARSSSPTTARPARRSGPPHGARGRHRACAASPDPATTGPSTADPRPAVAQSSSVSTTQTLVDPKTSDADTGNEVFHYVRKAKIAESAVMGTLVEALCGEVFPVTKAASPVRPSARSARRSTRTCCRTDSAADPAARAPPASSRVARRGGPARAGPCRCASVVTATACSIAALNSAP